MKVAVTSNRKSCFAYPNRNETVEEITAIFGARMCMV